MKKKAKENFESSIDNILLDNSTKPKTYWKIMKMLIKSNKGSNCIPPLRNTINDEHLDEMVYDKKCELLNKYFSLVSKLEEENIPVPPFESKTNDSITDIFVTASEIVDSKGRTLKNTRKKQMSYIEERQTNQKSYIEEHQTNQKSYIEENQTNQKSYVEEHQTNQKSYRYNI
jgi:hypothetical protein